MENINWVALRKIDDDCRNYQAAASKQKARLGEEDPKDFWDRGVENSSSSPIAFHVIPQLGSSCLITVELHICTIGMGSFYFLNALFLIVLALFYSGFVLLPIQSHLLKLGGHINFLNQWNIWVIIPRNTWLFYSLFQRAPLNFMQTFVSVWCYRQLKIGFPFHVLKPNTRVIFCGNYAFTSCWLQK